MFEDLKKGFDRVERARDSVVVKKREVMRLCRQAINSFIRRELSGGEKTLGKIRGLLRDCEKVLSPWPGVAERLLGICFQEYAEAFCLFRVLEKGRVPSHGEVGVPDASFLCGLGDCVGELRRVFLDLLVSGDFEAAEKLHDLVDELNRGFGSIVYPNSVVPNLKPKQDLVKRTFERIHETFVKYELDKR